MQKKEKQEKWTKRYHKVVRDIAAVFIAPYARWKYGITVDRFEQSGKRPYLVVMNHQTAFDQFFIGMAFKGAVYYLASEDIFSNGWVSSLIRWLVAPIPIKKQTLDLQAVKNCIRVAKEGGTIAIAPEGNRTYSGKTEYMNPSIAKLVRKIRLPIAIFRIEGGYGVQPRWSDVVRKGKMHAYVARVIEPEEYAAMSDDELFEQIREGLDVNEAKADGTFYHKKSAEYLECVMYVCPYCGLTEFESHGDLIECKKCGRKVRYLPTKELQGVGFDFPFQFVAQWYEHQRDFINALDTGAYLDTPLYCDTASLSEVIVYKKKRPIWKDASIRLYGDRIIIRSADGEEKVFPFEETSAVTVLGRNKLNIYHDKVIYQLKGGKRFNAVKYVNLFHRHMNICRGDQDGKFLGL